MQNFIEINGRKYPILEYKKRNERTQPCIFCGKRHLHGKNDGHRLPHCSKHYEITLSDGTVVPSSRGYYIKMT
jgi:hypothetical protein